MEAPATKQHQHDAAAANGRHFHRHPQRRHRDQADLGMTATPHGPDSPAAAAVNRTNPPARRTERPAGDGRRRRSRDGERERERERDRDRQRDRDWDRDGERHRGPGKPRPVQGQSLAIAPGRKPDTSKPAHPRRRHDFSRSRSPSRSRVRSPARSPPDRPSRRRSYSPQRSPRRQRGRSRDPPKGPTRESRPSPGRSRTNRTPPPARDSARDYPGRTLPRRPSLSPRTKRPRSPSTSLEGELSKKPRRGRSPVRPEGLKRGDPKTVQLPANPSKHEPASLELRSRRPRSRSRSLERHDRREQRRRSPSPEPRSKARLRSPGPSSSHRPRSRGRGHRSPARRQGSPSPRRDHPKRRSRSRQRSPRPPRDSRPPTSSDTASHRRPSPDTAHHSRTHRESPSDRSQPNTDNNPKSRDEKRAPGRSDLGSGANSVEVNMSARGGFRGGFHPIQTSFQGRGQYSQGSHDPRGFSQSSGHATPTSFHGSPTGHSPYGGNGRGWNGQQQFSPQSNQYGYSHNGNANTANFGAPTAPQSHFHSNPAHSPPYPPAAPTGPATQIPTGPGSYRGGQGATAAFRGAQFGPGRGGHRGGFKSTQWNTNPPSGNGPDVSTTANSEPPAESNDASAEDGENPFRPPKDLQVEDMSKEKPSADQTDSTSRPPPTGPAQTPNKFSFSMKNASKPAVAAPRPEISSKFNAPAPPREPAVAQKPPPRAPAPKLDRDRGFPRNAPTEPASARSRAADHRRMPESTRQPEPPPPPRTRRVKKIMKRLKEKPKLPLDLAKSKSVFFRKPGNESVVGSGTYGKVFKGLNVYTKKLVALKRIRMEGERDGFPVTAVREIKLLRSLSHTNVVQLQEVMVESNECFMVFEYLSHDLTGLLNHPNYTLQPAQKKHLAKQLFEGLDYLHTRGVLHRDIKAANILVSNEGVLKLADFGLARFYAKHHQLDYTNRVITIWYRSPELLLGETQYGPAVDIWSAACVLVEIFTKRAIFPGDGSEINQLDKIHSILGTPSRKDWPNIVEMPWFELLRPTHRKRNVFAERYKDLVTPAAFELLAWMFRYDPAKRPTSTEVLQHAYFTSEEPTPRQAVELKDVDGEWHEFESKALRRENEKKEKERARAAGQAAKEGKDAKQAPHTSTVASRDRKRPGDAGTDAQREAKRLHVENQDKTDRGRGVATG